MTVVACSSGRATDNPYFKNDADLIRSRNQNEYRAPGTDVLNLAVKLLNLVNL
jgi:hypothetical protein